MKITRTNLFLLFLPPCLGSIASNDGMSKDGISLQIKNNGKDTTPHLHYTYNLKSLIFLKHHIQYFIK